MSGRRPPEVNNSVLSPSLTSACASAEVRVIPSAMDSMRESLSLSLSYRYIYLRRPACGWLRKMSRAVVVTSENYPEDGDGDREGVRGIIGERKRGKARQKAQR